MLTRFFVRFFVLAGSSSRHSKHMPPPDRWDIYCPVGKVIPGTKFVAFKVPLKEELQRDVKEEDRFSPALLIKHFTDQGQKLGGIIDLTFTLKYYNKEVFTKQSIGHKKIYVKGHAIPSQDNYQEFVEAVRSFGHNDHLVGVHCTHGVNRTGYLICRYMIEELNMEPDEAINLFNEARSHHLERENYLEDLRSRKKDESSYQQSSGQQRESCEGSESLIKMNDKGNDDYPYHNQHHGNRRENRNFDSALPDRDFVQDEGRGGGYNNSWAPHGARQTDNRNNSWEDRTSHGYERFDRSPLRREPSRDRERYNHSYNRGGGQNEGGRNAWRRYDDPGRERDERRYGGRGRGRGRGWGSEQNYRSGGYEAKERSEGWDRHEMQGRSRHREWSRRREGYGKQGWNNDERWGRTNERGSLRNRNEGWRRTEGYRERDRSRDEGWGRSKEGNREQGRRRDEGWDKSNEKHWEWKSNREEGFGRDSRTRQEQEDSTNGQHSGNSRDNVRSGNQEKDPVR